MSTQNPASVRQGQSLLLGGSFVHVLAQRAADHVTQGLTTLGRDLLRGGPKRAVHSDGPQGGLRLVRHQKQSQAVTYPQGLRRLTVPSVHSTTRAPCLIDECDRHRPLGSDGKHGNRHTPTCGCDDR